MGSERGTLAGKFGTKKWMEPVLEILDLRRVSYWENALRGSQGILNQVAIQKILVETVRSKFDAAPR